MFSQRPEIWIWVPWDELKRLYERVDLGESRDVRAFLWPSNDQVKELNLVKFIPAPVSEEPPYADKPEPGN